MDRVFWYTEYMNSETTEADMEYYGNLLANASESEAMAVYYKLWEDAERTLATERMSPIVDALGDL